MNVDDVRIPYGSHTLKYPEHPQAESSQYGKCGQRRAASGTRTRTARSPKTSWRSPPPAMACTRRPRTPPRSPKNYLRAIVLASSNPGDLVLDAFLGSGTTAVVAEQLGRRWLGCDSTPEYLAWAAERIELVEDWPVEKWIRYDQENAARRKSIRTAF